ncbi:MAG: hypothetical protein WA609_03310 [Terriglobales bacterium]
MNTPKAAYWFALALFALAIHSEYQRGAFPAFHRAANNASATLCHLTVKAERTVAMARLIIGRPAPSTDQLLAGLDARQLADARRIAEDGAEMAREEAQDRAEMLRDEIREQVRDRVRDQVRDERVHARAEIVRAQTEMQRSQIRELRVLSQSRVLIGNGVDLPVISVMPSHCPHSAIRVDVPSIDLHMDDFAHE